MFKFIYHSAHLSVYVNKAILSLGKRIRGECEDYEMTSQQPDDHHLRAHPLLSRLLEVGVNVRAFRGYVGPDKDSGRVRLYPSLGDLNFSIEINKSDIVASAAAPETLLPHGGTVIWVKPDAEIVCRGDRINTLAARRPRQTGAVDVSLANVDETQTAAGRLVEVQTGRLNIQLRPRVMSTCASCSCSSCESHPSCTSDCNGMMAKRSLVVGP